jgi:uncharacterized RDD family membrane protein YckC
MAEPTSYSRPSYAGVDPNLGASGMPVTQTEGVLGRRLFAYLIDILVIFGLISLLAIAIFLFGIVTLTIGWWLYGLLFPPLVAIVYNALTISGPAQSTIGMRMMGLKVVDAGTGGRVDKITAAVHALLFYLAAGTFILWAIDIFIGMMRGDRRLGHDLITGVTLVRRL